VQDLRAICTLKSNMVPKMGNENSGGDVCFRGGHCDSRRGGERPVRVGERLSARKVGKDTGGGKT